MPDSGSIDRGLIEVSNAPRLATPVLASNLCREARTLLDWEEAELAFAARMSLATLQEFERGGAELSMTTLVRLRWLLERGGVEFTPGDGGRGVRSKRM
jgi:transcriptional regulator with XRE-family HTH domain